MKVAADIFRETQHYERNSFLAGLARCGYAVGQPPKERPDPDDVLLIWNRGERVAPFAKAYEDAGARVLVVENGYVGRDHAGRQLFAIAQGHHSGAGLWREGDDDRWSRLGIEPAAWRSGGHEIVVLPQRGIGEPGVAMPMDWADDVVRRLRAVTDRPIRVRRHPGKERPDPTPDLLNAWAAVTWASGAAVKAIVAGVPVFHEMRRWVGAPAARFGISNIEDPFRGDRLPMLRRLAWAQWTIEEIRSGEPFAWLLG